MAEQQPKDESFFRKVVRFVANQNFWLGRPKLDEFIVRFVPDEDTKLDAMVSGEGDVSLFSFDSNLPKLESVGINLLASNYGLNEGWYFNLHNEKGHPALKDIRVRQAIALALDRERLVKDLVQGSARVAASPWDNSPWVDPGIQPYPYDPEKAKALLDEAGLSYAACVPASWRMWIS